MLADSSHIGAVFVSQINDRIIIRDGDGEATTPNEVLKGPDTRCVVIVYIGYAINLR